MARRLLDPLDLLGVRLDMTGRYAKRGVLQGFRPLLDVDKVGLGTDLLEAAALYEEPPAGEVDGSQQEPADEGGLMATLVQTIMDALLDAQLEALDAAGEYTSALVTPKALIGGPGVTPALLANPATPSADPFLGRIGSQSVEQYAGVTPRAMALRVAGGATPEEAVAATQEFLGGQAMAEPHIVSRDAVATVATNDPRFVGYARKARADACDWCKMLASRGPVYSKDTAGTTREGQPYHAQRANGSGGTCKCRVVAMPKEMAAIHAAADDWRELRPGDKTAIAGAYKVGAQTPQRAGAIERQLVLLRETVRDGTASDWTHRRIATLTAEKAAMSLSLLPQSAFALARSVSLRYDPKQKRVPKGQPGGGRFGSGGGTAVAEPETPEDYGISHRPPDRDYGASMDSPDMMFPDLIAHPEYYSGMTGSKQADAESMAAIRKAAAGPTTKIKIHRAVGSDVPKGATINPGDWITPSLTYAKQHGESVLGGKYRIITAEALAGDLFTEGNSIAEWGWNPEKKRSWAMRYDPKQKRVPKGQPGGGRFGSGSGGGGFPEGWQQPDEAAFAATGTYQTVLDTGRGSITVDASVHKFFPRNRDKVFVSDYTDEEKAQVREAVQVTARHVARLQATNPVSDLTVRVTDLTRTRGGETDWETNITELRINSKMFRDPDIREEWRGAIRSGHNFGDPDDPVGTVVNHEWGHVLAKHNVGFAGADYDDAKGQSTSAVIEAVYSRDSFDTLSAYGKTSPVETYAELFSAWSSRGKVPAPAAAAALAEREGWK